MLVPGSTPSSSSYSMPTRAWSRVLSAYARATRCTVLTERILLYLPTRCSTDRACGVLFAYAMRGTG
eukprot:2090176-Rhodomonas_salina.1